MLFCNTFHCAQISCLINRLANKANLGTRNVKDGNLKSSKPGYIFTPHSALLTHHTDPLKAYL